MQHKQITHAYCWGSWPSVAHNTIWGAGLLRMAYLRSPERTAQAETMISIQQE